MISDWGGKGGGEGRTLDATDHRHECTELGDRELLPTGETRPRENDEPTERQRNAGIKGKEGKLGALREQRALETDSAVRAADTIPVKSWYRECVMLVMAGEK